MLISNRCISGLMSNLIKKSWTVSSPHVPTMFRWTWFAWGCQWMAIYLQHKTKRPRESVNWSKFYGWRHKHFSRQKWNLQYFGLIFVHGDSNLSSSNVVFWLVFWQDFFFFYFWMRERCLNFMRLNSKQAKCCYHIFYRKFHFLVSFTQMQSEPRVFLHTIICSEFNAKNLQ